MTAPLPVPVNVFCSQCGTSLAPDAKFCSACGNPVQKQQEIAAPQRVPKASALNMLLHGWHKPKTICSHCHQKGFVYTKRIKRKQGISGGKATGAFFTLGLSMLVTGLSRKQWFTEAFCANCKTVWHF